MSFENSRYLRLHDAFHIREVGRAPAFRLYGRRCNPLQPAGLDPAEGREIQVHVEGQAVETHPAAHGDPDAADLFHAHPGAPVQFVAPGRNPPGGANADHDLFQAIHQEADVVVENIDAIRSMMKATPVAEESVRMTNEALGLKAI